MGRLAGIEFLRRGAVEGGGPSLPLVMLHGIGSNAGSWKQTMEALPKGIDAIAWHAPGYESSDPVSAYDPSPSDYADSLDRLLDCLGFERAVLVGHSLGSLFAGRYAATRPRRVAGLGLLSPALGYAVVPGMPMPDSVQCRIDELNQLGAAKFADRRAARLVFESASKPELLAAVKEAMSRVHVEGYTRAAKALGSGDLIADAALIKCPTVVAVGAEDVVTPPAGAARLHRALKHPLPMVQLPKAGHALPQEAPAAVARIITRLVELVLDGSKE